jgi:hypothetical protein
MNFDGTLILEGANGLRWIRKNDKGLIEVYFTTVDNGELSLEFDSDLFERIVYNANSFMGSKKAVEKIGDGACVAKPDVLLDMRGKKTTLETEWEEPDECDPSLTISSGYGNVALMVDMAVVKALRDKCQEILDIRHSIKEVQKKKTIRAESV